MPRSVACPPSQRNATTARASRTWWLSVPTRRWRPPQALRTNMRLPRPLAQGPGLTSLSQRKRSALARLLWRAPPLPPRSPIHNVALGPRGGGNPEIVHRGESFTASLWHLMSPLNQGYLKLPSSTSHLWKMGGLYSFTFIVWFFFCCCCFFLQFLTSAAMATISGVRDGQECVWLICSHLVQLWQPRLEWWLQGITLVSVSAAREWEKNKKHCISLVLMIVFAFVPLDLSVGHYECFFSTRLSCRFKATKYPVGLIILKNHDASF